MKTKTLFIFRRDLRLAYNKALQEALRKTDEVVCAFITDPRQTTNNPYRSNHAIQFMTESLEDLEAQLRRRGSALSVIKGEAEHAIKALLDKHEFTHVAYNKDYTPFSKARDEAINKACEERNVKIIACDDALLCAPGSVRTQEGKPYAVFTPFWKAAQKHTVPKPDYELKGNLTKKTLNEHDPQILRDLLPERNKELYVHGGRKSGLKLLSGVARHADYETTKDYPALEGTTTLSAHNKFGTISIREAYHVIGESLGYYHDLIRQLYWRDFFTHTAHHHPHVFKGAYNQEYDRITWEEDETLFNKWCEGMTGFPIVDAGMRQLNKTGFMHNRVRMITASFLVKDLLMDWRQGEKYFATKLADYDPAINNGNWQWAASTGVDAQPYFRIFNPWRQQKKFDPDCAYIKKYVPELRELRAEAIHNLEHTTPEDIDYPSPVVEHAVMRDRAKELFSKK